VDDRATDIARPVTMPRKVLNSPFTFVDGTVVPKNNWICVPQQAIMQDEANYQDPATFNGFRFVKADVPGATASKFSTPSFDFPFWGSIKRPWYDLYPDVQYELSS